MLYILYLSYQDFPKPFISVLQKWSKAFYRRGNWGSRDHMMFEATQCPSIINSPFRLSSLYASLWWRVSNTRHASCSQFSSAPSVFEYFPFKSLDCSRSSLSGVPGTRWAGSCPRLLHELLPGNNIPSYFIQVFTNCYIFHWTLSLPPHFQSLQLTQSSLCSSRAFHPDTGSPPPTRDL